MSCLIIVSKAVSLVPSAVALAPSEDEDIEDVVWTGSSLLARRHEN